MDAIGRARLGVTYDRKESTSAGFANIDFRTPEKIQEAMQAHPDVATLLFLSLPALGDIVESSSAPEPAVVAPVEFEKMQASLKQAKEDGEKLRAQVSQLKETETEANKTIDQLTGVLNTQERAWKKLIDELELKLAAATAEKQAAETNIKAEKLEIERLTAELAAARAASSPERAAKQKEKAEKTARKTAIQPVKDAFKKAFGPKGGLNATATKKGVKKGKAASAMYVYESDFDKKISELLLKNISDPRKAYNSKMLWVTEKKKFADAVMAKVTTFDAALAEYELTYDPREDNDNHDFATKTLSIKMKDKDGETLPNASNYHELKAYAVKLQKLATQAYEKVEKEETDRLAAATAAAEAKAAAQAVAVAAQAAADNAKADKDKAAAAIAAAAADKAKAAAVAAAKAKADAAPGVDGAQLLAALKSTQALQITLKKNQSALQQQQDKQKRELAAAQAAEKKDEAALKAIDDPAAADKANKDGHR